MRNFSVEINGMIYPVAATDIDTAVRRAIVTALEKRGRDVRGAARGPVGLSVTIWDHGAVASPPALDDAEVANAR